MEKLIILSVLAVYAIGYMVYYTYRKDITGRNYGDSY
jgi:hypothetical protein